MAPTSLSTPSLCTHQTSGAAGRAAGRLGVPCRLHTPGAADQACGHARAGGQQSARAGRIAQQLLCVMHAVLCVRLWCRHNCAAAAVHESRHASCVACRAHRGAGTDADVFIELYGDKATIGQTRLDTAANNFERNQKDVFKVRCSAGAILWIRLLWNWYACVCPSVELGVCVFGLRRLPLTPGDARAQGAVNLRLCSAPQIERSTTQTSDCVQHLR